MEERILATSSVVLLIEEEPLLSFFTTEFLQDARFSVLEAATAEDALATLQTRIDVNVVMVSLEIAGPIEGLGLAKIISVRWPRIALILYSDKVQPGAAALPSSSVFVGKPYTSTKIVALIERLVKNNSSGQE